MKKLVIAGGNGFLGGILTKYFQNKVDEIVILTRHSKEPIQNIRHVIWDAKSIGDWCQELNSCTVLINLTGKNVNCRYTERNKSEILNSRLDATRILGEAIRQTENPPKLWLQASSSTIYNHSYKPNDENSNNIGDDFSMTVCKEWERTFWEEFCLHTKKIAMRISIVLGNEGGAFPYMRALTRFGLGGKQGDGNQMISWIHAMDFIKVIEWLIREGRTNSVYNVCSPQPQANKEFIRQMRHAANVTVGLPTPTWLLSIGAMLMQTEPELILKSRYVYPGNLLKEGFQFQYPTLEQALNNLLKE